MCLMVPAGCSAPVNRLTTPASDCPKTLAKTRAAVLGAERIPLNTPEDAFGRYSILDNVLYNTESDLPVSLGIRGDPNRVEILTAMEPLCGRGVVDRIVIYDAWAQVLRDQAVDAAVLSNPACRTWLRTAVRYDILLNAGSASQLLARFGPRDPDVRHIGQLVLEWAKQQHVSLPPLTAESAIDKEIDAFSRAYDKATTPSTTGC